MLLLLQPTGSVRVVLRPLWPLSKGVKAGSSTKMRKKELGEGQVRSHLSYMEVSGLSRVLEVQDLHSYLCCEMRAPTLSPSLQCCVKPSCL